VDRLLRWVAEDFASRGLDSPRLEAEVLLGHALGCRRLDLVVGRDRVLDAGELARFRDLVRRRRKHEPVAYLVGEREFFGHRFRVDRRALVPRPDTETLVEVALRRTCSRSMSGRMLDLCTGCGNVALSFSKDRPTWHVDAVDASAGAVELARDNAVRLGLVWNVRFVCSDLFESAALGAEPYDLVTANPPYIPSAEIEGLAPDVRDHEPRAALDGGGDGLDLVRRIVRDAPGRLVAGGVLALEVGSEQAGRAAELFARCGLGDVRVERDLGGRDRVVSGVRG
jgi:release factor glutamine methyltransferase